MQPSIGDLIAELGLPVFVQHSEGDVVFERMSREAPHRLPGMRQEPQSMRLAGGTAALIRALMHDLPTDSLHFDARVTGMRMADKGVDLSIQHGDGRSRNVRAGQVVAALPPRVLAATVRFDPALDSQTLQRWRDTPTWMVPHAKVFAIYDRPFWRDAGLSGTAQSMVGPLVEIHDATTASGHAALFGFVGVNAEQRIALGEAAYDAASFLVPVDPNPAHRWIGQSVRTAFALYNKITSLYPSEQWPCSPGGWWDFFGRSRDEIVDDLPVWAANGRMSDDSGMCRMIAGLTESRDQWNAYSSLITERVQGFQPGSDAREVTETNSFDPARMNSERTALFIIGSARLETSPNFVGMMTAAVIERFADAHGPLRALVVGEEWGQLYVSNIYEILTLYRQAGISFLGVFQNAVAQIEAKYGKETARIWKEAVAHTLYRGLPDSDTLREIEHRSARTSVMVRGFNVNMNQVNGSGDSLVEQSRPQLHVEDIRAATGGETGLLDSPDNGFYTVETPKFFHRPELSHFLRRRHTEPTAIVIDNA
ncbi:FAD-dependent oxidoreductase [Aureimonas altamirensis]|uniref:FAD-dependent oxidoreductase n=1 Tax=Aureimonas altamirensis TaxID=370622 RepID=UPI000AC90597|nr:FAD-dependent oxidoreductase [Aureimonas altamirensis]